MRGGFLRQSGAGIFSFLPLGTRVVSRMRDLIRQELSGQEVLLPGTAPPVADPSPGAAAGAPPETAGGEEQIATLALGEIGSFRHLPRFIYQFRFVREEEDTSSGSLVRFRERLLFLGYSLTGGDPQPAERYRQHRGELEEVLRRCRLPVKIADADPAAGGEAALAHHLVFLNPRGGRAYLSCGGCGYTAHQEAAVFARDPKIDETLLPIRKVATPEAATMRALADQLQVPLSKTAKAVFLMAGEEGKSREQFVVAVLRGDMDLNEAKLQWTLNAQSLRPAMEEEIRGWGIEPGYGSPVGVKGLRLVVDEAIPGCVNLVAGANEEGYHLLNVNYGRDFDGGQVADIALAAEGAPCRGCGQPLHLLRGTAVAAGSGRDRGICERLGATFQDREGRNRPVRMGVHSLDLGLLLVCTAEHHRDDNGLNWPAAVAPYDLHIVKLTKSGDVAERVYEELQRAGLEVLFDDREESPGVKFNDADLIGVPIRLTIGDRSLQAGGAEVKLRGEEEKTLVRLEELTARIGALREHQP
jgi:prolyl-tRNA synthetase